MRKTCIFITLLICLLFTSCRTDTEVKITNTEEKTTQINTSHSESILKTDFDEVVEGSFGPAYQSDIEKTDEFTASIFYKWRMNGNSDLLSNECVAFNSNEAGFEIKPLQQTYSLKEGKENWGIDVISISDEIKIISHSNALNLDKKIDGEWVRLTILDSERLFEQDISRPASYYTNRKEIILDSTFTIDMNEVVSNVDAGEYRFIFYIFVEIDGNKEYRKYHIPFTVTE